MSTGYEGGFTRRQELTCTETEMAAYADVVLYENEHIYIKMNSGMIRLKIGDGKTGLLNLPWAKVFDATLDDVEAIVGGFASRVETNTNRIENLEAAISPEIVTPVTDSTVAYTKTVPKGVLPNAAITEIGGMSYVKNGVLVDSKVEAIESVGTNLYDENYYFVEICGGKKNADGSYTVLASKMSSGGHRFQGKANKQYTVSLTITNATTNKATYVIFYYKDGTQDGYGENYFYIAGSYKFTSQANKTVAGVQFTYSDENTYTIKDFMLNPGSTAWPYSPYLRESLPIPVDMLDGWGQGVNAQYCNKIVLDPAEGVKKFVKRVKKITVNAENITMLATENYYGHPVALTDISTDGAILDGLQKYGITSIPSYDVSQGSYYWVTDKCVGIGNNQLSICDSTFATIDDFKALCPFDVVYVVEVTETDVSHLFTDDNLLPVEAGGTITAVNEFEHEVPFTIEYTVKGA